MNGRVVRWVILSLSTVLALGSLAWGCKHSLSDSADLKKRAVEFEYFQKAEDPYRSEDMTYPPTAPPVFALAIGPFADRGERVLKLGWLVLNLMALAAVCGLIIHLFGRDWPTWLRVTVCLIIIAGKPARLGIGLGQFHLIPLAFMLGAVALDRANNSIGAGILFGASLIKPTLSLPLSAFFLVRRRWKTLSGAIAFQAIALTITCLRLGLGPASLIKEWLERAKTQEAAGAIDLPTIARLAFPDRPISTAAIAAGSLVLGTMYVVARRKSSDADLVSFCCFLAAIFSYHRPYDMVLLLPPFALWVERARTAKNGKSVASAATVVFAAMLVAPSSTNLVGASIERIHDVLFVVLAHFFFWWEIILSSMRRED